MLSQLIAPYVAPTAYFSALRPSKIDVRSVLLAACVLSTVPLVTLGLGNLLGTYFSAYIQEYAIIFAFSLWHKVDVVFWQQILMLPVYIVGVFLYGGVLHLLLCAAQGAKATFPATLRCLCFMTPCLYLTAIPYSGALAAVLYASLFLGCSLKATHETTWGRVLPVIAVNIPLLLLACRTLFP